MYTKIKPYLYYKNKTLYKKYIIYLSSIFTSENNFYLRNFSHNIKTLI